jgi:hypothetical protein
MGTGRHYLAGAGTQTAGLAFGGYASNVTNATEHYDGSAWTAGGNMGTARYSLAGAGTQTAGLAFGGYGGSELMLPNIMMAQHGHLVGIWQQKDIAYLVLELKQQVWLLVDTWK